MPLCSGGFNTVSKKKYSKLEKGVKNKAKKRLKIFEENPFDTRLRNHPLGGKFYRYRSIDITGDIRALYEIVDDNVVYFARLDTHSNLYKK